MSLAENWAVWRRTADILFDAERKGFGVDLAALKRGAEAARADLEPLEASWAAATAGANYKSAPQLQSLLYDEVYQKRYSELTAKIDAEDKRLIVEREKRQESTRKFREPSTKVLEALEAELAEHVGRGTWDLPKPPVTKKGPPKRDQWPTDGDALAWLRDNAAGDSGTSLTTLVEIKQILSQVKYLDKLQIFGASGRLHCSLKRATETGRLAASEPELQQIPGKAKDKYGIRKAFVAPPGRVLVVADYSQLEMRLLAHKMEELGDSSMTRDLAAADCHSANALRVFSSVPGYAELLAGVRPEDVKKHPNPVVRGIRDAIKAIAYGINYGKSAHGLGSSIRGIDGQPIGKAMAAKLIEGYLALYPGLVAYQHWVMEQVELGAIATHTGRSRPVELDVEFYLKKNMAADRAREAARQAAWRSALNYPMQGGGADIVDRALIACVDRLGTMADFILQVHDELIFECDEKFAPMVARAVREEMENVGGLIVPLAAEVGIGKSWGEAK